jgi:O-antigen/teichoic acid export membrane protein
MKINFKSLPQNDFFYNVIKISASTILSAITIAIALPIITLIFSADELGKYQLLISVITLFGVVSCFKYEMAIVLPKEDSVAGKVYNLCLYALLIFCTVLAFVLYSTNGLPLKWINAENLIVSYWLIPTGVLFFGFFEIIKYGLLRKKLFNEFSKARLYQVLFTQLLMIIFGYLNPTLLSLFFAFVFGQIISSALFIKKSIISIKKNQNIKILEIAQRFKKFPTFNTPMVFSNTLSNELPVFFLATYFSSEQLGYYMLANRLIIIPMNLIGTAINKVYFQKASEYFNNDKKLILPLYINTTKKLIAFGLIPLTVLLLLSPTIVSFVFGNEWADAGLMMQILSIGAFFKFITSPIGTSFTIINKQNIAFYLTIVSLVLRFLVIFYFLDTVSSLLWAMTLSASTYYVVYHIFVYRLLMKISKDNK